MTHAQSWRSPRSYAFTIFFLLVNVGVYLFLLTKGVAPLEPKPDSLIDWGGNLPVLTLTGDYWRLAASMFLHGGLLHLAANMYMLIIIGPLAERRFGSLGMAVVYLGGGLLSSLVSAWWGGMHMFKTHAKLGAFGIVNVPGVELVVAVGASGALMALCGALLSSMLAASASGEVDEVNPDLKKGLTQVILINLALGFGIAGIDQAAHIGGLLGGLILGLLVGGRDSGARPLRLAGSCLVVAGILWAFFQSPPDEAMLEVRVQMQAEADEANRGPREAKAKAKADLDAAREKSALPAAVSNEIAAGRVLKLGESASAMVLSEDEKTAYVTDYGRNRLQVVDLVSGEIRQEISGPAFSASSRKCKAYARLFMCDGQGAANVALLPEQNLALVPSLVRDALAVVDLHSGKVLRSIPLGRFPKAMVVADDHKRAYVHNLQDNSVSVIDLENWCVLTTWKMKFSGAEQSPERPIALWLSGDGKRLMVTNKPDFEVDIFDTESLERITFEIPDIWFDRVETQTKDTVYGLAEQRLLSIGNDRLPIRQTWLFCDYRFEPQAFATRQQADGRRLLAIYRRGEFRVHMGNLDSYVSLGAFPVAGDVQQMQFSHTGEKLYVLGGNGSLSILDLRQRMADEVGRELLCRE
jgi:rhomboid protease GluP